MPDVVNEGPLVTVTDVAATIVVAPAMALAVAIPLESNTGPELTVRDVTPPTTSALLMPDAVNEGPLVTVTDVAATTVVAPLMAFASPMPADET